MAEKTTNYQIYIHNPVLSNSPATLISGNLTLKKLINGKIPVISSAGELLENLSATLQAILVL